MTSGEGRDEHPLDLAQSIRQQAQACASDDGLPSLGNEEGASRRSQVLARVVQQAAAISTSVAGRPYHRLATSSM